jgi:hypothetical protein
MDASDASGNPLASLALTATSSPEAIFGAGADLGSLIDGGTVAGVPTQLVSATAAVPEPSSVFLIVVGGLGVGGAAVRPRFCKKRDCR